MSQIKAGPRESGDGESIEGTAGSTPPTTMTTLTYRGVAYTPAEVSTAASKAMAPMAHGMVYRGCRTRAVIKTTVAATKTRTWLAHSYRLAF